MRSVGPFELTEAEFAGMQSLWREDERQLRSIAQRAALSAYWPTLKSSDKVAVLAALESIRPVVSIQNQPHSLPLDRMSLETGESGETAEIEAASETIRRYL